MLFSLIFSKNLLILLNIWKLRGDWNVSYWREIFPFQWKIALSWTSSYFIFQLFNPVLFATEGSVVAGQMGMTLAALNGVLGLSMSWINTKVPTFSNLISKKSYQELDNLFFKSFAQSLFITASGLIVLFSIVHLFQYYNLPLGNRFLSSFPFSCMCLSFFLTNIAFGLATYLRCHKSEPLLTQSVVFAIASAISTITLGKYYGVKGITLGYLTLGLTIGIPWILVVFYTKRKLWHQL
jgi:O-antigen/teichoic acid export membrane protein